MKKFFFLLPLLAVLLSACNNSKSDPDAPQPSAGVTYIGTLHDIYVVPDTVTGLNDSIPFTMENLEVTVTPESVAGLYSIFFNKVKFAETMPVNLDITVPGVSINDNGAVSGEGIVPIAMGGEFPQFTVSGLHGRCTADSLTLDFKFGTYPTSYVGIAKK